MIIPPSPENISRAAQALRTGGIVAFPTETVYGLGSDARNSQAIRDIFRLKGRPSTNPLIVHVASIENLSDVVAIEAGSLVAERLGKITHLWPGPLSAILPKNPEICREVTANGHTVAVRIPAHPVARDLLTAAAIPVAAPSANPSSCLSPTRAEHVYNKFGNTIPIILDGGPCSVGLESTVVNLTGAKVEVMRPGGISWEDLYGIFGSDLAPYYPHVATDKGAALSPGLLPLHYAPRTPLQLIHHYHKMPLPKRVGIITFGPLASPFPLPIAAFDVLEQTCLSTSGDLPSVAANLFSTLQRYDTLQLHLILVDSCPREGIGAAIMDRLDRAVHLESQKGDRHGH